MLGQLLQCSRRDGDLEARVPVSTGCYRIGRVQLPPALFGNSHCFTFRLRRHRATRFTSDWERRWASNQGRGTNRSVCYHKRPAPAHHHRPNMNSIARLIGASQPKHGPSKKAAVCGSIARPKSASKVMDIGRAAMRPLTGRHQFGTGTLDAHDPHMRPPARGEKYDSMGSPHSTQAEKSGR